MSTGLTTRWPAGGGTADVALALLAVLVIALMILPLPPWLLDVLITLNIASGVLLLLFALYVATPLSFSTFPSVLLFTTLFRIALNVASTRQILLSGHAGDIIEAFGRIVVGGSLIVGLVVFFIITIVQFVVIAKGAERVAEVGARFTLDALPGKQMAIDSDLRAGLLSAPEAMRLRERLGQESQFFGAMDGAMKFVKGDAAASIVIVLANLLGGLAVGVLALGLPMAEAIGRYAVLAIGDGLVTQIPALFIAMAAGVVVTRTAPEQGGEPKNLAQQIGAQVSTQPRALVLGGAVIVMLCAVPGFPIAPFVLLGAGVALLGWRNGRRLILGAAQARTGLVSAAAPDGDAQAETVLSADAAPFAQVAIEFHDGLLQRLDLDELNRGLAQMRLGLRVDRGLPFPGLGLRRSKRPAENMCWLLVREVPVRRLDCPADLSRADLAAQVVRTLQEVLLDHAAELIGVQETRQLVAHAERRYPDLVREANTRLPLPRMAELLQQLVTEGVPVRDVRGILEAVVQHASPQVTFRALVNWVRIGLGRDICHSMLGDDGALHAVGLTPDTETRLRDAVTLDEIGDRQILMPPEEAKAMADALAEACEKHVAGPARVLVVPLDLRWAILRLTAPFRPTLRVMSHDEIARGVRVRMPREFAWPPPT